MAIPSLNVFFNQTLFSDSIIGSREGCTAVMAIGILLGMLEGSPTFIGSVLGSARALAFGFNQRIRNFTGKWYVKLIAALIFVSAVIMWLYAITCATTGAIMMLGYRIGLEIARNFWPEIPESVVAASQQNLPVHANDEHEVAKNMEIDVSNPPKSEDNPEILIDVQ